MSLQFLTNNSWWPLFMSLQIFGLLLSLLNFLIFKNINLFLLMLGFLVLIMWHWFRDFSREVLYLGSFNFFMQMSSKMGMIFFILSEVMFFISFFWSYFHYMFLFSGEMAFKWPPVNLEMVDFMSIPLLNTLILLSSGVGLTVAHNGLLLNNYKNLKLYLLMTVFMGLVFTLFQLFEYKMLEFLWSDSSFGSIFFMGTGFHGLHVIIGSTMLIIVLIRMYEKKMSFNNSFFELSSWYWHFVDMVWIILFSEFYWWSTL